MVKVGQITIMATGDRLEIHGEYHQLQHQFDEFLSAWGDTAFEEVFVFRGMCNAADQAPVTLCVRKETVTAIWFSVYGHQEE